MIDASLFTKKDVNMFPLRWICGTSSVTSVLAEEQGVIRGQSVCCNTGQLLANLTPPILPVHECMEPNLGVCRIGIHPVIVQTAPDIHHSLVNQFLPVSSPDELPDTSAISFLLALETKSYSGRVISIVRLLGFVCLFEHIY